MHLQGHASDTLAITRQGFRQTKRPSVAGVRRIQLLCLPHWPYLVCRMVELSGAQACAHYERAWAAIFFFSVEMTRWLAWRSQSSKDEVLNPADFAKKSTYLQVECQEVLDSDSEEEPGFGRADSPSSCHAREAGPCSKSKMCGTLHGIGNQSERN